MSEMKTYPLRLPQSLKDAVERLSKRDGTSINQFNAIAVAEKVPPLKPSGSSANGRRGRISKPSTES